MAVTQVGTPATPGLTITGTSGSAVLTGQGTATSFSGTQPRTKGDLLICVITGYSSTSCAATAQNSGTTGWTKLVEVTTQVHTITAIWGKYITAATGAEPVPVFTSVLTGTASHMRLTTWLYELAGADWDLGNILTASSSGGNVTTITCTTGSNVLSSGWYALSGFCEGYTSVSSTITYTKGASWSVATGVAPNTFATSTYAHSASDQYSSPPSGSTLAEVMTISAGTYTSVSGAFIVVPPAPETSPSLELYGFAIPSPPHSGDTINSVTVAVTEYQSSLSSDPCTFELWDYSSTPAIIGTTQTGTSSTSTSNVSSATFTGVTYSQLATLRVRVYGNGRPGSSYTESVDGVSLAVNYTPSPNATVTLGGPVTASASIATPSVNAANIFPATVAATAAIATPMVNGVLITPATVAVTASVPAPAVNPVTLIQPGIPAAGRRGSTRTRARIGPAGLASAGISPARAAGTGNATVTIGSPLAVTSAARRPGGQRRRDAAPATAAVTSACPRRPRRAGRAATSALAATSARPAVSVSTGETASPAAVAAAASVPPPALSTGVTLAVSAVAASTAFPAATASGNAAITAGTVAAAASVPSVTAAGGAEPGTGRGHAASASVGRGHGR